MPQHQQDARKRKEFGTHAKKTLARKLYTYAGHRVIICARTLLQQVYPSFKTLEQRAAEQDVSYAIGGEALHCRKHAMGWKHHALVCSCSVRQHPKTAATGIGGMRASTFLAAVFCSTMSSAVERIHGV